MSQAVFGIDPGGTGAVVMYDGRILQCWDMPMVAVKVGKKNKNRLSAAMLASIVRKARKPAAEVIDVIAFVELVNCRPKQGAPGMFAFGKGAGIIEGVLAGLRVPYTLVTPQRWKKEMGIRVGSDKDASRARAAALLPKYADLFMRKKDDGRAEAALIALYGWKHKEA